MNDLTAAVVIALVIILVAAGVGAISKAIEVSAVIVALVGLAVILIWENRARLRR